MLKARKVTVKGAKGEVTKDFGHVACEMKLLHKNAKGEKGTFLRIRMWNGSYKRSCGINTIASLIKNMMTGVTYGFQYKMRLVYAHFPINVVVTGPGDGVEIRNFLGEKIVRKVKAYPGVKLYLSKTTKDEIIIEGNDVEMVSLTAARIQQSTTVKKKDIRKFLDGIYVSEKTNIVVPE